MNSNAAGLMVVALALTGCGDRISTSVINERSVAVTLLCQEIQAKVPEGEVVLVLNPLGRDQVNVRELQDETVALFRRALNGRTLRTAEPALMDGLTPSDWASRIRPGSTAPLSYIMKPEAFESIAREYPGATVLVSLVGMPDPGSYIKFPPAMLLLPDLLVFGHPASAMEAFHAGRIRAAAVVVGEAAVLITADNAHELIPQLDW